MHDDAGPQWSPARLAYGFYTVAATGAIIGQTWVAYTHVPWPPGVPAWVRVTAVLPFALCLELLAMALAAMADERLRLGERAYGFRVFSALIATVAVGILILGHWPHYYWSATFGILSTSAYLLWLLHSSARRRDALRATGKLADTAPDYGLWRRLRYPIWTARAAELAREGRTDPATGAWRPLNLYESLRAARLAIRADKRRPALACAVEQVVRADHPDARMADIAVYTLDLDRIAAELEALVDYMAWADRLAPAVTVPATGRPDRQHGGSALPAAGTHGAISHPGKGRHLGGGTRIVVRQRRRNTEPVAVTPIIPAGLDVPEAGPTAEEQPTEQSHNGASFAHTITDAVCAPPDSIPFDDHHHPRITAHTGLANTGAGAPTDAPITEPINPDPVDVEPVAVAAKTTAPSETAAAVAYWHEREPLLHPSEIAARVGRSERHVRRILAALDTTEPNDAAVDGLTEARR